MIAARRALLDAAVVVPHTDADGLAAGAIGLRARGEGADAAILLDRGQTPFADDAPLPDGLLAILDWGVRPLARPALLVDHHVPEDPGAAGDPLVVSSFGERPDVSTAPLMRRLVPAGPPWLAAVGGVGDLGDAAFALPECAGAAAGGARARSGGSRRS